VESSKDRQSSHRHLSRHFSSSDSSQHGTAGKSILKEMQKNSANFGRRNGKALTISIRMDAQLSVHALVENNEIDLIDLVCLGGVGWLLVPV
jgi:hypothetical protein